MQKVRIWKRLPPSILLLGITLAFNSTSTIACAAEHAL